MPRKPRKLPAPTPPKRRSPGTGSVGVRSDSRVFATLPVDLDPQRRPHYGPGDRTRWGSVEEARAWLDATVQARRRPPPPGRATPGEPLGSYLARWYENHEDGWPERTRRAYLLSISRWASIGTVPLGQLTREVVQGGIAALRRARWQRTKQDGTPVTELRPYSERTIQQARVLLHQALQAIVPDVLAYNPASQSRSGRRQAETEQPVWSAEQAGRFLEVAERTEPRYALALRLILFRALRLGEAADLKRDDVDEDARRLRIDETAGMRRAVSGPTKTRRIRHVPLSADLIARIRAHRRDYPTTSPHLFTLHGERVSTSTLRAAWHRVIRVAGLPTITPKDGRATCATILLDEGWPLPEVARLLGHASVATTATHYQRTIARRAEEIAEVAERMDATLDRAARPPRDEAIADT